MKNKPELKEWLLARGVQATTVTDLLQYVPRKTSSSPTDDFFDAKMIMDPDRWFYWPNQKRFVLVGQCPSGDAVAIDTEIAPGAIFYVSSEVTEGAVGVNDYAVKVANSPSDYVTKRSEEDFPWDFREAQSSS